MLLVSARVGISPIHGFGLFAREFIECGTCIWKFNPSLDRKLRHSDLDLLSDAARVQVLWYAYWKKAEQVYVLSGDDDRFTNHSDSPNTETSDSDSDTSVAVRNIEPNQEITWRYPDLGRVDFRIHELPYDAMPERT